MNKSINMQLGIQNLFYSKFSVFIVGFITILSFCSIPELEALSKIINYIAFFIAFLIIVFYIGKGKISWFAICLTIYAIFLLISTFLSQYGSMYYFMKTYFQIISITFYLDYGLKRYSKDIINSFFWVFFILVLINFYTIIKYPNGWYTSELYTTNWFFGYDNTHIFMYFPALLFMLLRTKKNKIKISFADILLFLMITYGVYYCFSANSVVAYTIFLIYLIFRNIVDKINAFNSKNYFISYIVIFYGIVIFRLQEILRWLIVDVLGKSLNFSTRTIVWDRAITLIKNKWLLGYGQEQVHTVTTKYGDPHFTHAHNTILDVVYKGGILSFIPHLFLLILPTKELYNNRENKLAKMVSVMLFCIFIMMNFEARQEKIGLYIILIASYNIKYIITNTTNDINNEKVNG